MTLSRTWRRVIGALAIAMLMVGAFALGGYAYKEQLLRRAAFWYDKATTELAGKDMLRFVRHYDLDHMEPPCSCPDPEANLCSCEGGGQHGVEPYERNIDNQIKAVDVQFDYTPNPDFPRLVHAALGYDTPQPRVFGDGWPVEVLHVRRYRDSGDLEDLRIVFDSPPLELRALAGLRDRKPDTLFVVMHGLWSSENHVMGLDYPDYMDRIGERMFEAGVDVLAMNLTTNPEKGAFANLSLHMLGTTLQGLQSRATCEAIRWLRGRRDYDRVVVYGISNGGWITDHMSVLCDQADLYISDEQTILKKSTIWKNERYATGIKYPIFIQYLEPLFARSSVVDYLLNAKAPRVHIAHHNELDNVVRPVLEGQFPVSRDVSQPASHRFIYKQHPLHAPEFDIIMSILGKQSTPFEGYSVPLAGRSGGSG